LDKCLASVDLDGIISIIGGDLQGFKNLVGLKPAQRPKRTNTSQVWPLLIEKILLTGMK
jgi:hypothetical protein